MNKSRGKICLRACDEGNFCLFEKNCSLRRKNYDYVGYGSQKSVFWLTTDFQRSIENCIKRSFFFPLFSFGFSRFLVFLCFKFSVSFLFDFLFWELILLLLLPRSGFSCLYRVHVRIHHKSILPLTNFPFSPFNLFFSKRKTLVLLFWVQVLCIM